MLGNLTLNGRLGKISPRLTKVISIQEITTSNGESCKTFRGQIRYMEIRENADGLRNLPGIAIYYINRRSQGEDYVPILMEWLH